MIFYVGVHHPSDAKNFERSFISINTIRNRKSPFEVQKWIMDSGAFTEISTYGEYRFEPEVYGEEINRWRKNGGFQMAVTQDYMCEPFILKITGKTVEEHQKLTVERYKRIVKVAECPVMPVLQGYQLRDYLRHREMYGDLITYGQRVGVGSVCKRNANISEIEGVLMGIHESCPSLKLHGFGVKTTALKSEWVWRSLFSADSMAWSFAARREGRDGNDWREGKAFEERIYTQDRFQKPKQLSFL